MKVVGEITFDVFYLVFVSLIGLFLLKRAKSGPVKMMGYATLFLVVGDAFHLVPRILDYLLTVNLTGFLGFGKLVTSFTMTIFYVFLYWIYFPLYHEKENSTVSITFYFFMIVRFFLLVLPTNHWFSGEGTVLMGIIRNIPFVIMGGIVIYYYFKHRKRIDSLSGLPILMTLSFLFYIPVVILATDYPIVGMLMIPKTICYIILCNSFLKYSMHYANV